jgi:hypothetical protein
MGDTAALKRCQRRGRERGWWVYIAAEQLEQMGVDPQNPEPPLYRVWEAEGRPRAVVNLYPQKPVSAP